RRRRHGHRADPSDAAPGAGDVRASGDVAVRRLASDLPRRAGGPRRSPAAPHRPGDRGTRGAAAVPRARRGPLATLLHLRCRRHRAAAARPAARRRLRAARCAVREVVSRLGGARLVPRAPACDGAAPMRLGASLPLPPGLAMCRRAAERVEALGYDSVWIADTGAGPDAFVVGAAVATCTTRLRI